MSSLYRGSITNKDCKINKNAASTIKYVPNSFKLHVLIEERSPAQPKIETLDGKTPYEGLPFIVMKRGAIKTLYNMLVDVIERETYKINGLEVDMTKLNEMLDIQQYPSANTRNKKFIARMALQTDRDKLNTPITRDEYHDFRRFENIANGRDVTDCEFPFKKGKVISYDVNANRITWDQDSEPYRYAPDNSYVIIYEDLLHSILNRISLLVKSMTDHQMAAYQYATYVCCAYRGILDHPFVLV